MTNIENFRSIAGRTGYDYMPIQFSMCPDLESRFGEYAREQGIQYEQGSTRVPLLVPKAADESVFRGYYHREFKPGTIFTPYGVAKEPGDAAAFHMTRMYHPMEDFDSPEEILAYPFPDYSVADPAPVRRAVEELHAADRVAVGYASNVIWEPAWYLRGMENLMVDMMMDDPMAELLLDKLTQCAIDRVRLYAGCGVDVIHMGDDVGSQTSLLMSEELYCTWLKPRLTRVIAAIREVNPDILVLYHSCGYVKPLIPHLIDAGIDILNPVQPECMDFREIHREFGDKIAFNGTIGTQSTMPFGTPEEVRREVFRNLEIAGDRGGLFVAPTHLLEPEVPVENVAAYIQACKDFT
ncbi:MAG: hypothetical protein IKM13_04475 [Clostridia bacterium]|nr:hypothetical protein [Clostridia bacterium]